jgi:DNA-binding SARP family transcriptional activator/tetratricopeptide (TPR) repeat protein
VEFRLLGPIELANGHRQVESGPPQRRHVLAGLAVDAGRVVTTEALVDRVWDEAPSGARRTLHTHIAAIRRMLENAAGAGTPVPLVRRSGGYLLDVDPVLVDLHRFRQLMSWSREPVRTIAERAELLKAAVALWRGAPLSGLAGRWADRMRQAWQREHLDAVIAWSQAEVGRGNAAAVTGPLAEILGEYPLAEPLAVAYLKALSAVGERAAAMEVYHRIRCDLAEQLGVDPCLEAQELYHALLAGDPPTPHLPVRPEIGSAASQPPAVAGPEPPPRAERTLPSDVAGFVGRHGELRQLLAAVDTEAGRGTRTVAIYAVDGMAGVGKTAFAVHAAHQLAYLFPDGQRFVDLRAHAPGQTAVDPSTALEILLQADGIAAQQIPAGLQARAGLWRERMSGKKVLLVLDDAVDSAHVAPLLPATSGCLVLITSRRKLATLPGVALLSLDTLPPDDAAGLFRHRAGSRADGEPAAVARITRLCGYLPLAITLTAARLHVHSSWSVADLADDLDQARDRLATLTSGNLAVAAAFELSYLDLPADRKRLFRRLALHPGPDLDAYAAAALDQTTYAAARRGLEDLLENNLIIEPHRGRYRFHDLIAAHARTHAATDPRHDCDAAFDRLSNYYARTATIAAHHQPGLGSFPDAVPADEPSADGPTIADPNQANDWFTTEQPNLAAVAVRAATRHHAAAIAIPAALHEHLRNCGPFDFAVRLHRTALAVAEYVGDRPAQAHTLIDLADTLNLTGDYPAAAAAAEHARGLYQQLDHQYGQAAALETLALTQYLTSNYQAAANTAEHAYRLFHDLGDVRGQAKSLDTLALVQRPIGDYPAAATAAERSHALYEQLGHRRGQAAALDTLARVQLLTGDYPAAATAAERSHALYEQLGHRRGQAAALDTLARVQLLTGDYPAAATAAGRSRTLHEQLGNPHGQALALDTLARVQHAVRDYPAAAASAELSRALYRQIDNLHGEANAVQVLGIVHHATGNHSAAATTLDRALHLFREVGDPDGEADTLNHIGQLRLDSTAPADAHQHFTAALDLARRVRTPIHEARANEGIGHCLLRQGNHHDGINHLHDALDIYRSIHAPGAARVEDTLNQVDPRE